ncbi:MAG: tetratricopeptide repeat protein [Planctomycetota bacterium]
MSAKRQAQSPAADDVFERVLQQVASFLAKNVLHIALVAGVLLVAVLGYKTYVLRRRARTFAQWEALAQYPKIAGYFYGAENVESIRWATIEECRTILAEGPRTSATPWVLLKLANLQAEGKDWAGAADSYRRLLEAHPKTQTVGPARSGLAVALEELGRYGEAAEEHARLVDAGLASHLLDVGRCKELTEDAAGAERSYRQLLGREVPERLRAQAKSRLAEIAAGRLLSPPPELEKAESGAAPAALPGPSVPAETPMESALPRGQDEQSPSESG